MDVAVSYSVESSSSLSRSRSLYPMDVLKLYVFNVSSFFNNCNRIKKNINIILLLQTIKIVKNMTKHCNDFKIKKK